MTERTPPRKSPRFQKDGSEENSATGSDTTNTNAPGVDAAGNQNNSASQALQSESQVQGASQAPQSLIASTASAATAAAESECSAISAEEGNIIGILQKQISVMENRLQSLQMSFTESECQKEALKMALQASTVNSRVVVPSGHAAALSASTSGLHAGASADSIGFNAAGPYASGVPQVSRATGSYVDASRASYAQTVVAPYVAQHATVTDVIAAAFYAAPHPCKAAGSYAGTNVGSTFVPAGSVPYASVTTTPTYTSTAVGYQASKTVATHAVAASAAHNADANIAATPMAVSVAQSPFYFANAGNFQTANAFQQPTRIADPQPSLYATIPPFSSTPFNPLGASAPELAHANSNSLLPNGVMMPRKLQDLPEFSGHAEDWPIFFASFYQSTSAYGYTNLENNQRLQRCLKGEARDTVKSLLIHPDNVNAIIEQLRFRFGRPEQMIRSQLSQVKEISPISEMGIAKLIPFATKVKNLVAFLQSANGQQHLANPTLIEELVSKLPMSKRIEWARCSSVVQPYATIVHFSDWLTQTADLICTVQGYESREPKRRAVLHAVAKQSERSEEEQQVRPTGKPRMSPMKCAICQSSHKSAECQHLLEATVADRWNKVKRSRLCFSCLNAGHTTRDFRRRRPCLINGCQKVHHKMLHDYVQPQPEEPSRAPSLQQHDATKKPVLSCSNNVAERKLLFRILPVTLYGGEKRVDTYALLDEGSSVTLIDSTLTKELGLRGQKRSLNVQWIGGRAAQEPTTVVDLCASGAGMGKKHKLRNVYSVTNLNLPSQSLSEADLRRFHHMQQLPLEPYSGAVPKLLIGIDHCHLGLPSKVVKVNCNGPYAANTELGWTVFGPSVKGPPRSQLCLLTTTTSDQAMHGMVADYFETENFGVKSAPPIESADDMRAKAILQSTTRRINGRFETGLLWKQDNTDMPHSYEMARKRLVSIEKKMQRNDTFATAHKDIISSYVAKEYARKLQPEEVASARNKTWYLPHFGVVNPNKPTKLRLVFDAAAEAYGVSLNSQLLKGPQDYRALPAVLFHFREGAVAVCGDIKEMFHQVVIRPEDRWAQRFLWRDGDTTREPDVYEMKVMTFGAACSPCAAQYVKTLNAVEHANNATRAVKAILDYHYVDDFVDSFDNVDEAISISLQVRTIHQSAGFELRNFTSNSTKVLTALGGIDARVPIANKMSVSTEKVLGMFWQPSADCFKFKLKFHNVDERVVTGERRPTKRELLSIIMSIFDPLGFLSHITIAAKLIMREIWRRQVNWDEPLPDDITIAWERWRQLMPGVMQLQIPRFYFRNGTPQQLQLHVFVDASEDAFAAVAYWRATNSAGEVEIAFISSKAKCAPLKPLTVPRLELQAAVLGTRLMQTILDEHSVSALNCVLWTDSKTVVKWIKSEHRRYKPFVAHRVAEILATTTPSNWRWIPTDENVADEATRDSSRTENRSISRWLRGPRFLLADEKRWPTEAVDCSYNSEVDEELRPKYALVVVSRFNFNRFSSLNRLVRVVAWVMRFANKYRRRHENCSNHGLTSAELDVAKRILYRQAQHEAFQLELKQIENGHVVSRSSSLYQLTPYVDDEGILRVNGRIDAASWLPMSARQPVILPPNHALTKLIVAHYHCALKHQNTEATICEIRRHLWIPRLRQILRNVIANCFVCRLTKAAPITPIMGPLPADRLTPFVRPFTYTGLDYFGPVNVTIGRRQEKRWVALFTCLTMRAVHLELAFDLSTDACIMAIRNFINRRGVPVRLRSDNGKNFVGANQEAKRFSEVFDCERVQDELASKGVEWLINCPINPSEGGIWERMVQCVKRVLRHTLKEVAPREHTLQCFLIEAENVVNSRPLTHLPIAANQEEPLTPNHFLLGTANTAQTPSVDIEPEKICALRKQWRISRQLRDHFWKRWIAEYLPTLTRRAKWCEVTRPLKEGDVVFVCDANVPRKQWCRGVIERVYPGVDGVVRQADVRTARGGIIRRAASKLAVLNLDDGESERFTGGGVSPNDS